MMFPTTHSVSIYNFEQDDQDYSEAHASTADYSDLKVTTQPAGVDILAVYPGLPAFQTFKMYVWEKVNILNGAKVTDGSRTWYVRGVAQVQDYPFHYHQQLILEEVIS